VPQPLPFLLAQVLLQLLEAPHPCVLVPVWVGAGGGGGVGTGQSRRAQTREVSVVLAVGWCKLGAAGVGN
jgi:hypothetical protein